MCAGWTVQEFCASRELVIKTQKKRSCDDMEHHAGFYAVLAHEERLFWDMREEYLKDRAEKKPIWIYGPGIDVYSDGEVASKDEKYAELSTVLQTQYEEDMIRALYPILWGRPVESQEELMTLIWHISQRTKRLFEGTVTRAAVDLQLLRSIASAANDTGAALLSRLSVAWSGWAKSSFFMTGEYTHSKMSVVPVTEPQAEPQPQPTGEEYDFLLVGQLGSS